MKKILFLTLLSLALTACVQPVPRYRLDVPNKYATPRDVAAPPPRTQSAPPRPPNAAPAPRANRAAPAPRVSAPPKAPQHPSAPPPRY